MPSNLSDWLAGLSPWSVVLAVLSVVVGWVLARVARRTVATVLARLRGLSPAATSLTARAVYYAVLLLAIGIALSFLGAPVQPLLAAAVIVGVIAAIALRGISDNFASGIVLQTRRPIDIGDLISSDDRVGTVVDLNGRTVVLRTADGLTVHLPNSAVLQSTLINYSTAGPNRSEVEVRLDPAESDREALTSSIAATTADVPGVDDRPVQLITVLEAPQRLVVRVRFWTPPQDSVTVTSAVVTGLADSLRSQGTEAVVTSILPPPTTAPPTSL
jgi:small conductance mechanosensitive channel